MTDTHRTARRTLLTGDVRRQPTEVRRVVTCTAIGLVVATVVATISVWQLAVLCGWCAGAITFCGWVWHALAGADAAGTEDHATREDSSRVASRTLLLTAAAASLVGVLFGLARAANDPIGLRAALTVAALATVVASWVVIQTVYTLRYARLFYSAHPGGIDFPGDDAPDYRDFAYLAFTVGMTFQVADTDITDSKVRHTLLGHALLAFLFGAVIVAVSINVVAGFV